MSAISDILHVWPGQKVGWDQILVGKIVTQDEVKVVENKGNMTRGWKKTKAIWSEGERKQRQYEAKVEGNKGNMKVEENKGNMMVEAVAGKGGKHLRCTFLPLIWEDAVFYRRRLKSANQSMVMPPMLTIPSLRWQVEKGDVELNRNLYKFWQG